MYLKKLIISPALKKIHKKILENSRKIKKIELHSKELNSIAQDYLEINNHFSLK